MIGFIHTDLLAPVHASSTSCIGAVERRFHGLDMTCYCISCRQCRSSNIRLKRPAFVRGWVCPTCCQYLVREGRGPVFENAFILPWLGEVGRWMGGTLSTRGPVQLCKFVCGELLSRERSAHACNSDLLVCQWLTAEEKRILPLPVSPD